jgi:hypothetical protein
MNFRDVQNVWTLSRELLYWLLMKGSTPRRQCTVRTKPIIIRLSALLLQLLMNIIITLPVITIIIVLINTVISLISYFTATQ